MKIVVIIGTEVRGITYHLKEVFLENLRDVHDISEFYLPKDLPYFCTGCKLCILKGEQYCPHAKYTQPIWQAILEANLLVFVYPMYVLRAPGQVKAFLDHLVAYWTVHRPNPLMFEKQALIITQSIGAPNHPAQKDVETSLNWLGVSSIKKVGFGLMEGVIWNDLSKNRRDKIEKKLRLLSNEYLTIKPVTKSLKVKVIFFICKLMHQAVLKKEETVGYDNQYWIEKGWIKPKK
jgi:NAD(P)H-dependent FMN reductase